MLYDNGIYYIYLYYQIYIETIYKRLINELIHYIYNLCVSNYK